MILNYLKIAFRNLRKNQAYAMINILGLTLGITCGILIFKLVMHHLSFDNFHHDSGRIYRFVTEEHRDFIDYEASVPNPFGKAFRNDYTYGEKVARLATFEDELITVKFKDEKQMYKETISFVETDFFDIFNFPLLRGDFKKILNTPNTAILTESMAKKYFKNTDPINQTFKLNNEIEFKVAGILKDFPVNTDFKTKIYLSYLSLGDYSEWHASDDSWGGLSSVMQCYARLTPGSDPKEIEKLLPNYVKKYRAESKNVHHYKLQTLKDIHVNPLFGGTMPYSSIYALSLIGLFIIITACVNFINLATAQALNRSREVGIRKVLGSLRKQLFWQFIMETALITSLATLVAIELAIIFLPYVNDWFQSELTLNLFQDWQLVLFIPLLAGMVTFLAGSYPGLILAGFKPVQALKGKVSQHQIGGFNTRRALIVVQLAIAQVLIIGVIVVFSQMNYIKNADLGYAKDAIIMITMGSNANTPEAQTLKNKLNQIPAVEKISLCFSSPAGLNGNWGTNIRFQGRGEDEGFSISHKSADENYLSMFDLELVAGRNIHASDTVKEFLVNETLIRKLNLGSPGDILGKKIAVNGGRKSAPVVGVIKDFHDQSFHRDIQPIYITTDARSYNVYALKINPKNMGSTVKALEKAFKSTYPEQLFEYQFLDEGVAKLYRSEETMFNLIQTFSFIAIFIGCLGLYGLVSFMALQKNKEIGIRKVLGGTIQHILWLFGKEFMRLILIAFVIASPIAWLMMNGWLQDFKFRVEIGAWMFMLAILISFGIAACTIGYKAIRAALINPVDVLKNE